MGDPYADIGYWSAHWLLPCKAKCYIIVRRLLAKSFSPYTILHSKNPELASEDLLNWFLEMI
jgi:hypothetical protein